MLKVKNISKVYNRGRQEIRAIDGISFDIAAGEFAAIVGPSGSGKSTLLMMLGGMMTPSQGSVSVDEHSLYDLDESKRTAVRQKKIGFLFQTFNLIPYLTALQNVQVPLLLAGYEEEEQVARARLLLERVGLSDRAAHTPSELSVGQQQRVALARMLANDPALILADEPTGNLDPTMSQQVFHFLSELNREGKTIVLVTHDEKIAKQIKRKLTLQPGGKLHLPTNNR